VNIAASGQVLNRARAGDEAEPLLRLSEDRGLPCSEAHVARQCEFAASAAYAPFDLRNRDESACAQIAEQHGDRGLARQLRRLLPILVDPRHVHMRNEIIGLTSSSSIYAAESRAV
jgi:hypothetical protein